MNASLRWIAAGLLVLGCCRAAGARPALLVYPGSFDPVHRGHVSELKQVLSRLRAEQPDGAQALILPNHDRPRHLPGYVFSAGQREALLRSAFSPVAHTQVAPAFDPKLDTYQQLEALAKTYGKTHELYLLLGEDAFRSMRSWRGHERVLARMNLLVSVDRARIKRAAPASAVLGHAGAGYKRRRGPRGGGPEHVDPGSGRTIRYLPTRVPAVRSREVAMHLMAGLPVDGMVTRPVARALSGRAFRRAARRGLRENAAEIADKARASLGAGAAAAVAANPARLRRLLRAPRSPAERQARSRLLASNPPRARGRR